MQLGPPFCPELIPTSWSAWTSRALDTAAHLGDLTAEALKVNSCQMRCITSAAPLSHTGFALDAPSSYVLAVTSATVQLGVDPGLSKLSLVTCHRLDMGMPDEPGAAKEAVEASTTPLRARRGGAVRPPRVPAQMSVQQECIAAASRRRCRGKEKDALSTTAGANGKRSARYVPMILPTQVRLRPAAAADCSSAAAAPAEGPRS